MAKVYDAATDLITFARLQAQNTTSGSSYLGSDGLLKFAAEDEPRIEYGSDGSLKGLLIEEQRTNLVTHSEDFSTGTGAWSLINVDTSGASEGPDGATDSATQMLETATTSEHQVNKNVSLSANTAYTLSAYVSPIGGRNCTLFWYTNSINTILSATFDITSESVVAGPTASGSAPPTNISADIQQVGSFYRVSISGTTAGTAGAGAVRIHSADGTSNNFLGDAAKGLNIYGAQLEEGSFATSYIPTSGSQSTRSPDIASIPVSAFGYNQSAGTVVVEATATSQLDGTMVNICDTGTQGSIERMQLRFRGAGIQAIFADGGVANGSSLVNLSLSVGDTATGAWTFNSENTLTTAANGTVGPTDTSHTVPTPSELRVGRLGTAEFLNGHIKSLSYFPRRLTNAQLQELTS